MDICSFNLRQKIEISCIFSTKTQGFMPPTVSHTWKAVQHAENVDSFYFFNGIGTKS